MITGRSLILTLAHTIETNAAYLSEIDGAIGDGDHGVNMAKGFQLIKTRLADQTPTMPDALDLIGNTLLNEIGGSMGPIYGTLFLSMANAARDKDPCAPATLSAMLTDGLAAVTEIGSARVGDKTLIDTLAPAERTLRETLARGTPLPDALQQMADAADHGRDTTRDLVAKKGRAARLGERSRGTLDAGATSCALILRTLANLHRATCPHTIST